VNALAARRRHPAAIAVLLVLGLALVGAAYSIFAPKPAQAAVASASADKVAEGRQLFLANCASCHGLSAEGTKSTGRALVGVGAASVDFQVGTGRMPLVRTERTPGSARSSGSMFNEEQIAAMAAYVDSVGGWPGDSG
jgi:ubiquinol-cytochrome c reductase cytochrome c subunit